MEFSLASINRIFKRVCDENNKIRVSKQAKELLGKILSELASDIASEAISLAYSRGQTTVTEEDIKNATIIVLGEKFVHKR